MKSIRSLVPKYFPRKVARRLKAVCAALVLLSALPGIKAGQYGDFTYTINGSSVTITRYTGAGGEVTIPDYISSLPVQNIGSQAFAFCNLTKITIPGTISSIGDYAFWYCRGLTSATLLDGVANIGNNAFIACFSLTTVTIPGSVTNIGDGAFFSCNSLTDIVIPGNVTSIGNNAFNGCTGLTSVYIPASVARIGSSPFASCGSLTEIMVDESNGHFTSLRGALFDLNQTTLIQCPAGAIGGFEIPAGVTTIGSYAFGGCTRIASILIPGSVTTIADNAFSSCSSLTSITLPGGLTSLGNQAFFSCSSLTNAKIPDRITRIGDWLFAYCSSLTDVSLPASITGIGDYAFRDCSSLASITLPANVTSLGTGVFFECHSLAGVYFKGNAPTGGTDMFYYANQATIYYLPHSSDWTAWFGGRPTALWRPKIQTDPSLGVRTNRFGFNVLWTSGQVIVVEACTNLPLPAWSPLQTNTLDSDSVYFDDSQWTNFPGRFYRLRAP